MIVERRYRVARTAMFVFALSLGRVHAETQVDRAHGFSVEIPPGWIFKAASGETPIQISLVSAPAARITIRTRLKPERIDDRALQSYRAADLTRIQKISKKVKVLAAHGQDVKDRTTRHYGLAFSRGKAGVWVHRGVLFDSVRDKQYLWFNITATFPKAKAKEAQQGLDFLLEHFQVRHGSPALSSPPRAPGRETGGTHAPVAVVPPNRSRLTFPTYGFAIDPPPEAFTQLPSDQIHRSAQWGRFDQDAETQVTLALLWLDLEPHHDRTLEEFLKEQAESNQMILAPDPSQIGGREARDALAKNLAGKGELRPVRLRVCKQDSYFYVITLFTTHDNPLDAMVLQRIAASWTWMPLASPADHLELDDRPAQILSSSLKVRIPRIARSQKVDDPSTEVKFAIQDLSQDRLSFLVQGYRIDKAPGLTMQQVVKFYSDQYQKELALDEEIIWTPGRRKGKDEHYEWGELTHSSHLRINGAGDERWRRYAIVDVSESAIVIFSFLTMEDDEGRVQKYSKMVDAFIESIE